MMRFATDVCTVEKFRTNEQRGHVSKYQRATVMIRNVVVNKQKQQQMVVKYVTYCL